PNMQAVMSVKAPEILYRGQNAFLGGCTSRTARSFCHLMKLFGKGAHRFPPMERHHASRCLLMSEENSEKIGALLGGTILFTPGHTADSLSLLRRDGALFCGDAAMNGFPSFHRITIWAEDKAAFAQSWETILEAKPTRIYPGHGKPFDRCELVRNLSHVRAMTLHPLS
ncbi:MBL fold metallo-hydrolase, partial [Blautia wexlerae]|nr:MBL fold metallo-hydrolase [Blautia wexlerae]